MARVTFDNSAARTDVDAFIPLARRQSTRAMTKAKSNSPSSPKPSTLKIWLTAARPHTLTASLSPCLVAYGICSPPAPLFAAWVVFCLTVQLGTNLHNDYADFVKGADTKERVGQARATAQGWLTPTQTCVAATTTLAVTLASGMYLVDAVHQWRNPYLWFLILSSIFNAFAYTGGPYPLGWIGLSNWSIAYAGQGDVFVFLYFGLVATLMLPYLMLLQRNDGNVTSEAASTRVKWSYQLIYAIQVGLLATNIIVGKFQLIRPDDMVLDISETCTDLSFRFGTHTVNNLRDRHTDVSAGKRTTAVRFGRNFSIAQYILNNLAVSCLTVYNFVAEDYDITCLLPLLCQPLVQKETTAVMRKEGAALNPHVGGAAKVQLAFCVLLTTSLLLRHYEDTI